MGRDYVTVREEQRDGETVVMEETSVGRMLAEIRPGEGHDERRSLPHRRHGVGTSPIAAVEVKVDDGAWTRATLGRQQIAFAWRLWHLDWPPTPGEHTHHVARHRRSWQRAAGDGRSVDRQQEDLLGKQRPDHAAHPHSGATEVRARSARRISAGGPRRAQPVKTSRTAAGDEEVEEDEAIQDRCITAVQHGIESPWRVP